MAAKLTQEQKHKISVSLVGLIVEGFREDQEAQTQREGWEQNMVRLFACSYACNNTKLVADVSEAHDLCDRLLRIYYRFLLEQGSWADDKFQELQLNIQERFTSYYRATAFLGKTSEYNVPLNLRLFTGSVPFEAFVLFENYFRSFVMAGAEISEDDIRSLAREPMQGHFGLFLKVWNEAEQRIRQAVGQT